MRTLVWLVPGLLLASVAPTTPRAVRQAPDVPRAQVVEMVLQDGAYRFVPAEVEARTGDRITFVLRSGGPHNIAFDPAKIDAAAAPKLAAGMPDRMSALAGPLLTEEGASYTISLEGVPPGSYSYFCMPHLAMGMTGTIRVTR